MARILGISGYYHDSAAALVVDGELVSAAQEERFTRIKHDRRFPSNAIRFCLSRHGMDTIDHVVFYDKPLLKFDRILETHLTYAPAGVRRFTQSMPSWLQEKLFLKQQIRKELAKLTGLTVGGLPPLLFTQHHQSHAGSAFYCSPFDSAAVLCIDGVGEWATTSAWRGSASGLEGLWQINFPHSLGLLYSAFTYFCGFEVNDGEYKLMGLAPFGAAIYADKIKESIIDIKPDGTFRLNLDYFDFCLGEKMTSRKFGELFGASRREAEAPVRKLDMDMAASIQVVIEEVILKLAATIRKETGLVNLCLAGGVALNCVANGRLRRSNIFEDVWAQPASGDAGGAIGAAYCVWHELLGNKKSRTSGDLMKGCLLGPSYSSIEIKALLDELGVCYQQYPEATMYQETTRLLGEDKVVGWFQGRMEFGPRALGGRSILGDPRSAGMQRKINTNIKFRESFRPFAPAVLMQDSGAYFDTDKESPYMMFVEKLRHELRLEEDPGLNGIERVDGIRSCLPAVTHIDFSTRVQTVNESSSPTLFRLLGKFKEATGCSVLINTSFNVRGEPIVESPLDAVRCFMNTNMDALVLGDFVLKKHDQVDPDWRMLEAPALNNADDKLLNTPQTDADLKRFARSFSCMVVIMFGLILPWMFAQSFPVWPWVAGFLLLVWGEFAPGTLRRFHLIWHKLGYLLSRITSPVLLGAVYFLVLTPVAIAKRQFGSSRFRVECEVDLKTYREACQSDHNLKDPF